MKLNGHCYCGEIHYEIDGDPQVSLQCHCRECQYISGGNPAALMKSHGAVTVGADIVEAFVLANYLEENAQRQYMALQIGTPYVFSEQEIAVAKVKLWNRGLFERTWAHFRAKLAGG